MGDPPPYCAGDCWAPLQAGLHAYRPYVLKQHPTMCVVLCPVPQVGALYLEMLFGQVPMFWLELDHPSERIYLQEEVADDSTPYGQEMEPDDRKFVMQCTEPNQGRRLRLVQLLQDPWVTQHLGWPEEWGVT